MLPQLQGGPKPDGLLPAGLCPHLQQRCRDRRQALPWGNAGRPVGLTGRGIVVRSDMAGGVLVGL